MPDPRFFIRHAPLALDAALDIVRGDDVAAQIVADDGDAGEIARVAALEADDLRGAVVFCQHKDIEARLGGRAFALCLTRPELADVLKAAAPAGGAVIACREPRTAFARLAARLYSERVDAAGEAPVIADDARIHPSAVIAPGAEIGAGARIGPHVAIGPGVVLGEGCRIEACVSIRCALVGARTHILAGARIGEDGFGFAPGPGGLVAVPQLGRVLIGDDVTVGANSTIDRGALADTVVGDGTKIDNLVQIGHNVRIGRGCVFAGQSGVSGSSTLGAGVVVGGQVGISDHVVIGDGARIAAQSGVMRDIPAGETWGGTPAAPGRIWMRAAAAAARHAKKKAEEKR